MGKVEREGGKGEEEGMMKGEGATHAVVVRLEGRLQVRCCVGYGAVGFALAVALFGASESGFLCLDFLVPGLGVLGFGLSPLARNIGEGRREMGDGQRTCSLIAYTIFWKLVEN